ncbi:alpha/beta fold hydrolase [Flavobacterium sp. '19STA2R22 D10 B1']|uniref:alpha/beta fold hydrolase n=1 Tax=Flavobacterium aerium TaxID=3037261 RepID=UPI00278BD4B8|nr:alpha/beta hydrolase [Flavobacterium sp. '19STA2R22 D10 B1']
MLKVLLAKSIGLYINVLSYIAPTSALKLAYRFFSEPREGRFALNTIPKILQEAEQNSITHNDMVFQTYTWKGNEHKILLIHGWESNASRWEPFLKILKNSGSTIIALDAPAHGLSSGKEFNIPKYAEFVNILVEKFQPEYIVGHSLGGATCLYYMEHYATSSLSIQKIVILGAPSELRTILTNYVKLLSLNDKMLRSLEKHLTQHFKIILADFSGKKFASKIKIKGLIAHDIEDTVVAFEEGKQIAASWQMAEFIETKGLGHSLHDDHLYGRIYHFLFEKSHAS